MDALLQDVKFAFRSLRQSPGLFLVAAISLALGIAVNVTIFAGVDLLLVRPLNYPNTDRMVQLWSDNKSRGWQQNSVSLPDFSDWRRESKSVAMAAYADADRNLADGDRPERVGGLRVSPSFFSLFGIAPSRGRFFRDDEEQPGREHVAVLSDAFWRNHFGADSQAVGRPIRLDGEPYTIVGILPHDFRFESGNDVFTPLVLPPDAPRASHYLRVIGLLRPGASLDALNSEIGGIATRLADLYPSTNLGMGAHAVTLLNEVVDDTARQAGTICMVAVFFVLLIACANVANLLLSRAAARNREIAVRSALGAGRGRLVRQLLTESLMLAVVGGVLGLLLSVAGIRWLGSIVPNDLPGLERLGLDPRVLLYGFLVILAAGVLAGVAPALQVTRGSLTEPLKEGGGGRGGSMGLRHGRLRASLVVIEMSLALVLLISAGLLIKASLRLSAVNLGFDPGNTLSFAISLDPKEYPDTSQALALQDELQRRLAALPGVTGAAAVTQLPMSGGNGAYYYLEGEAIPDEARRPVLQYRVATADYLAVLKIPLAKGRSFSPQDRVGSPKVVLINETLAKRHWPQGNPLGRRLVFSSGAYEIVGVVKDVREFGPDDPPPALAYFSASQYFARTLRFVLRSAGDPAALGPRAREAVAAVAHDLPPYSIQTVQHIVDDNNQSDRIMPKLLGVFGAIALLLSLIGVYGVMAYSVSQRTQELGIRRALGAEAGDIVRLVVRQAVLLAAVGAGIGLALSFASTKALSSFLFGVSAFDPFVFSGVTLALLAAVIAASLLPARRATRVDPLVALRAD
ncbi:MAG TPA: ABC transporter permease [Gemmatimonadales bacterium]|jgi:putative ABC transport system permease protein|nr:ABC transporter permease [Gemmatimonadales bacterium]